MTRGWIALIGAFVLSACAAFPSFRNSDVEITSIATFDPVRYAGTWHEIARFPTPFQSGCTETRAVYDVVDRDTLSVQNICRRNGSLTDISGTAKVDGPGRLKVRLKGVPFAADYWVLWVDEGYRTAVVGVPSGRAGWILNRDPVIPDDRLRAALSVLEFNGYDTSRLIMAAPEGDG